MRSTVRLTALAGLTVSLLAALPSRDSRACGAFFGVTRDVRRPSLSYEQVLLVHDDRAGREHFVRAVTFDGAAQDFGFVVPTPTRPEVASVHSNPFPALRRTYPYSDPMRRPGGAGGEGIGFGQGHGRLGGGVEVLEQKTVGSFTAFVLQADDAQALQGWLAKNKLLASPEAEPWLAHYVRRKFFYVAMKHDATSAERDAKQPRLQMETVRISFDTPVPFYPYLEPPAQAGAPALGARLLELWVVTREPVVPVSLLDDGASRTWVRPMRQEMVRRPAPFPEHVLEDELSRLLPAGPIAVQTFQDQKVSRAGYGDVLFARVDPGAAPTDDRRAALRPLLAILDPELGP